MMQIPQFSMEGKKLAPVEVDEAVFGPHVKRFLLRQAVLMYEANRRVGTADTKTRKDVSGSGRKPWPQKHTGRARAGSKRSPIWRHGGTVFGPHPRDYSYSLPKKALRQALNSAVLSKLKDGQVAVVDRLALPDPKAPKTRAMAKVLSALKIDRSCLIGTDAYNRELALSTRNLPRVSLHPVADFNAYEVLRCHSLIFTKAGLDRLVALAAERSGVSKAAPAKPEPKAKTKAKPAKKDGKA